MLVIARPFVAEKIKNGSPAIGKPAPQLDLIKLSDDLSLEPIVQTDSSKVTLIHFWGTWCPPCRIEYPELISAISPFRVTDHFEFLSVSCSGGDSIEDLWKASSEFFESAGVLDDAVYADPRRTTQQSAQERLERDGLFFPTSIVVNHEGTIVGVWEGYSPNSVIQIKESIEKSIKAIP